MKEFENKYLNYILDSRGNEVKIIFIGFLLTINLAFYAGLYYLNKDFPFFLSELQFLVLGLLIIVNILFSVICVRENYLDKVITYYVKEKYIEKKIKKPLKDIIGSIYSTEKGENDKDWKNSKNMMRKSWMATKGLLAIVNAIPLTVLTFCCFSHWLSWSQSPCRAFIFVFISLIIGGLVYLCVDSFDLREEIVK